jgi:hypothetical protein
LPNAGIVDERGVLSSLLLQAHERDQAWAEIEQELSQFEGPNGFDAPGEVLIGIGTK